MNQGILDFRAAISGSSNLGTWTLDNESYNFYFVQKPFKVQWLSQVPPNREYVEDKIKSTSKNFFNDCEI